MGRQRGRQAPKIQNVRWLGGTFTFGGLGAGSAALTFLTAGNDTETILRVRGELIVFRDGLSAPASLIDVALGAIVMPEGQGTTVVSDPATDSNAPWFLYERGTVGYEEMVTDVVDVPGLTIFRKEIDVKAMRIIRPGIEAQLVHVNTTIEGAQTVNTNLSVRALFGAT